MTQQQQSDAYDMVDRYLRNNMDDVDYEIYSQALDVLAVGCAQATQPARVPSQCGSADMQALILARLTEKPAQVPSTCVWTQIGDAFEDPVWESTCGELWSFIDGGPKENRVSYCHHCGKKVELPAAPEAKP